MLKYILLFSTLLSMFFSIVEVETQAQEVDLSYELLWQVGTGQAMSLDWRDRAPGISVRTTHDLHIFDPETLELI